VTRDEVITILGILKAGYPNFYKDMRKEEAENVVNLWAMMFESENAKVVTEAIKALMCTLKYPPTIADVKEKIALITQPPRMTEMEAWDLVRHAIRGSNYYAKENFDNLPAIIRKLVGSPNQLKEWAMMDIETVQSVVQSNFMRSFAVRQKSAEQTAMLPESTKTLIGMLSEAMALPSGKGD
jgi:hypothetical protein